MKWKILRKIIPVFLCLSLLCPRPAKADFFGGDLPLLMQIVVNSLQQLAQLRSILGNGQDTLHMIKDINRGINEAMGIIKTLNTSLRPGLWGDLRNADDVLRAIQDIYGMIPKTPESRMQKANDQTVAEAIDLHNQAFRYADNMDPEAERIKDYARNVSPVGAAKLTAQSMGMMIHVLNQVLRTNAAMLKILGQDLAMQNKREKLNSQQFQTQYEGLSKALGDLRPNYDLPSVAK